MLQFETIDDILDFAIVQEIAAQELYNRLSGLAQDAERQAFFRAMAAEEAVHEKKLRELKDRNFELNRPDLEQLQSSGYLDALPIQPDMSQREVLRYVIKKEKSANMLYKVLADSMLQTDMAELFRTMADEEAEHTAYFHKEYEKLPEDAE